MIQVSRENGKVVVSSPYNRDFITGARRLGGRWDSDRRVWVFDAAQEGLVRQLLVDAYGYDPLGDAGPLVTVRWQMEGRFSQEVWGCGRRIVERPARDAPVRFGDGVVLVQGEFPNRGGSRKYPEIGDVEGVVLEIRNVPRPAAERFCRTYDGAVIVTEETGERQKLLEQAKGLLQQTIGLLRDAGGDDLEEIITLLEKADKALNGLLS